MDILRSCLLPFWYSITQDIDSKNPDKEGITLERLIVETKLFQIHDQRL